MMPKVQKSSLPNNYKTQTTLLLPKYLKLDLSALHLKF